MLVRSLVGRMAGQIVEMPYHVARDCLLNGTVVRPDAAFHVPVSTDAAIAARTIPIPPEWASLHGNRRRALAGQISGKEPATAAEADTLIRAHLGV